MLAGMLMYKKTFRLFSVALVFLCASIATAQVPPTHTSVLYQDDLVSAGQKDIGYITNSNGSFQADGWKTTGPSSKLVVELNEFLPHEGTMQVKIKNLNPATQVNNDWSLMSLWSRSAGSWRDMNSTPGSYVLLKTEPDAQYISGGNVAWKLVETPFYGGDTGNPNAMNISNTTMQTWDATMEHTFKIIWNPQYLWIVIDGEMVKRKAYKDQIENFEYIFLGSDNEYGSMAGPTFTDLQILVPSSSYSFENVTKSADLASDMIFGEQGVSLVDLNNDGLDDIYLNYCNTADGIPNALYMNSNSQLFTEDAGSAGIDNTNCSNSSTFADFDGDGDIDLFIAKVNSPNKLYINNGSGVFSDQSTSRGISSLNYSTVNAMAIDIENDGDLDIFAVSSTQNHELYVNQGDGTFSLETRGTNNPTGAVMGAVAGDVNNDGFVDIFIAQRSAACGLLINDGTGNFSNEAASRNANQSIKANNPTMMDYDNDGDLDIFLAPSSTSTTPDPRVLVLKNNGNGVFTDISNTANINIEAYGLVSGDIDNDGYEDLYAVRSNRRDVVDDHSSRIYLNNGDDTFTALTGTGAEAIFSDGRAGIMMDYDNDGLLDLYGVSKGNLYNGSSYDTIDFGRNQLLKNTTETPNNWLKVVVNDIAGNPDGIGAKIWVYEAGRNFSNDYLIGYRDVYAMQGYTSQGSMTQHFGVGSNTQVDVKIQMPGEEAKTINNVVVNRTVEFNPSLVVPHHINVSGHDQTGIAGNTLANPLQVYVYAEDSTPAPGITVQFDVTAGGGTLDGNTETQIITTTDENGLAEVTWKMGTTAGQENTVRVTSSYNGSELEGSPFDASITPVAGDPAKLVKSSGDAQTGYILQFLDNPIIAQVTDAFNNPVAGHNVIFTISTGGGSVDQSGTSTFQVQTDQGGLAQVNWLLGETIGTQTLNATSTFDSNPLTNSPLSFSATGLAPQQKLQYQSGNYQTKLINSALDPFTVQVVDFTDAPISGEEIEFKVISGNGTFGGETSVNVLTNAQGIASATATLGSTAGDTIYVFHAISPGASGSPVIFKASATPGSAAKLAEVTNTNYQSGPVNRTLENDIAVLVTDASDNPVPGYTVTFTVSKGGGKVEGATYANVISDENGKASAAFKLGTAVGENIAIASADALEGSPITFFADGEASTPARIDIVSGNNQSGNLGQQLAQPFVVVVRDSFFNAINNHTVQYSVTEGDGNIEGLTVANKQTNEIGRTSAYLTLGTTAYTNIVQVSAFQNDNPLINSPVTFVASTGPGDPKYLVYESGNNQIGRVSAQLPSPFKVKVTDENGIPVKGHEVQFISYTPGAHFSGSNMITAQTDANGFATATPTLGSNYTTYEFEAVAKFNNVSLGGSPLVFEAYGRKSTATQIENLSTGTLTGTAGLVLGDSLKIRVKDGNGNPVANHPVEFQITSGSGSFLNDHHSSVSINSNSSGVASVAVTLRQTPGTVTITAISDNGLADGDLDGSPINYTITAVTGVPDPDNCTIQSTDNVLADGQTPSQITVTLKDAFENPVSGKTVMLESAGIEVIKTQPQTTTNTSGQTSGSIVSENVGQVYVWAVVDDQIVKRDTITFVTGSPAIISTIGSGQFAVAGKTLTNTVGVWVQDEYNHPIPGVNTTFTVVDGGGSVTESQPITTNSEGKALVHWQLGSAIGLQHLNAAVDGVAETYEITAIATAPTLANITKVAGDSAIGLVNQEYQFTTAVIDTNDNPIVNYNVSFELLLGTGEGQGNFTTATTVATNNEGKATVTFESGTLIGLHKIKATATDYGHVVFDFIVEEQRSITMEKLEGDGNTVRPNTDIDLSVKITNAFNQPVSDESIKFQVVEGLGVLKDIQPVATSDKGIAYSTWSVSTLAGTHKVKVTPVNAVGDSVNFTAIVVNAAPVLMDMPATVNINWGEIYDITITAEDPDEDNVHFGIRGLPLNAEFDSTGTQKFTWEPSAAQEGEHEVTFIAADPYGLSDSTKVTFNIMVENRCPIISSFEPADTTRFDVEQDDNRIVFKVSAMDPDYDVLTFEWRVNDVYNGSDTTLTVPFSKDFFPSPNNTVQVLISDGSCQKSITWKVVLTAIELNTFEAISQKGGIELFWETSSETQNAGFYIIRSTMEQGTYERINTEIISPSLNGEYSYVDTEAKAGITYYYKLQDIDIYGSLNEHGPVTAKAALPDKFALSQNYPNPFNPSTTISFELPEPADVKIVIFNTNGQLVKTLVDSRLEPGYHNILWNAKNDQGISLPSGIYFYKMQAKDFTLAKKLLLLK